MEQFLFHAEAYALQTVSRGEPNAVSVPPSMRRFALYFDLVWNARRTSH